MKTMNKLWMAVLLVLALAGCNSPTAGQITGDYWGDSVSIGAIAPARQNLYGTVDFRHDNWEEGSATPDPEHEDDYISRIASVAANDGTSCELLGFMEQRMMSNTYYTVIAYNAGVHDLKIQEHNGRFNHAVSLVNYRMCMEAVAQQVEQHSSVHIFINTTPVPEDVASKFGLFHPSDVSIYNSIADDVAKEHGFYILETDAEGQLPQNVHFSAYGYQLLGKRISDCVMTALSQQQTDLCHR